MKVIEKVLLFCWLILALSCSKISLSIEESEFEAIKENLIKAVNNNNYDEANDILQNFKEKMASESEADKPVYLHSLLYEPLKKYPKGNSVMDVALQNQNLTILYLLLSEDNKSTKEEFLNYLNNKLEPKIIPKEDSGYLIQRSKLVEAITNDAIQEAEEKIKTFKKFIKQKFIIPSKGKNRDWAVDYFNNEIWPKYSENLANPEGILIKTAFTKQNFAILYLLFKYLGNAEEAAVSYINYIDAIKLSDDKEYQKIKEELIQAVTNNEINIQELLENLDKNLRAKYYPKVIIETSSEDAGRINQNYIKSFLPDYIDDLLKTLIPIALKNKNFGTLYILLNKLNQQPDDLLGPFINTQPFIKDLIEIENISISDELNQSIITSIRYLIAIYSPQLDDFLKKFKGKLKSDRFENIMLKVNPSLEIAEYLQKQGFIIDLQKFLQDLKQYNELIKIMANVVKNQNIPLAVDEAKKLSPEFINKKDINGNSLLINLIKKVGNQNDINKLETLIKDLKADVNQAGKEGITPLMHAIDLKIDFKIRIPLIELLLNNGADVNAKDIFGKTALDYANETKNDEIIDLVKLGSKPEPIRLSIQEQLLALNNLNSTLNSLANKT